MLKMKNVEEENVEEILAKYEKYGNMMLEIARDADCCFDCFYRQSLALMAKCVFSAGISLSRNNKIEAEAQSFDFLCKKASNVLDKIKKECQKSERK